MSKIPDFFTLAGQRFYLRIWLFLLKWAMRLLSASAETWLRKNFGRNYALWLFAPPFMFLFCSAFYPHPTPLTEVFLLGLFVLTGWHIGNLFVRRYRSRAEPHSGSAGVSWSYWKRLGLAETTTQRYLEPALCGLAGGILFSFDQFLGGWLMASGLALFVKQQISDFKLNRRVMDALDAKLEAQRMNTSLTQYQQKPGQGAQKSHRAHFPGTSQRRHP